MTSPDCETACSGFEVKTDGTHAAAAAVANTQATTNINCTQCTSGCSQDVVAENQNGGRKKYKTRKSIMKNNSLYKNPNFNLLNELKQIKRKQINRKTKKKNKTKKTRKNKRNRRKTKKRKGTKKNI